MFTTTFKRRAVKGAIALAATSLALPIVNSSPAGADPKQFSALVVVGSDTTQAVMDALAGETNGTLYTPIKSSAASGNRQIANWIAASQPASSLCITPQAPGATILRPVGSTAGRKALSRAILGEKWGGASCGTTDTQGKAVAGLVHVARSSDKPASGDTGTDLTYLPFARDALSFAYYKPAGGSLAPVTSLTRAQLDTLFTTGPAVINGVKVIPCGIQTNSGTYKSWNTAVGVSAAEEDTGTELCSPTSATRVEEHDSDQLRARGDAVDTGTVERQVIVGMGAGPFISQWNGAAVDRTDPNVDLGVISDSAGGASKPYNGTIGTIPANLTPNATYYGDATFGRDVYNVIDSALLSGPASANQDYKTLLVGSTSAICAAPAQAIVNTFGFLTPASCGSTALKGSFIAGSV